MTTMISEVYSAFIKAGVPENDAREAAEALSAENLATKSDIKALDDVVKLEINRLDKQLSILKWMVGYAVALLTAIALKVFA